MAEDPEGVTRPTVLLVEDNADHRAMYSMFLKYKGIEVLTAVNGDEAIAIAREHRPSVIVMDLGLPRVNGYDAAKLLRLDPSTADIPIVVLTANTDPFIRSRSEELGVEGYLVKPIDPSAVYREVARVAGVE
jgi:CheY-like chemotaxis protein